MEIFEQRESQVRSYCRSFPVVFQRAEGSWLWDEKNQRYLDFLAGAGTLNYGHNNPALKQPLLDYIAGNGVTHGLDMFTEAKAEFLQTYQRLILEPRGMDYRIMFVGPTGTNAVEAALKAARKATGRHNIVAFTNGFHGMTLGALAATGNQHHRGGAGMATVGVSRMPFSGYYGADVDTVKMFEQQLNDPSSGLDKPAAVLFEVVQGEGGLNVASDAWLRKLEKVCRQHGILMIADDIQCGCGRTGHFFAFEPSGIRPDIITQSKSLSGYGLPFAIVLLKPELDQWKPGEHNGTFRGNNHAFVTATAALKTYWQDSQFAESVQAKGEHLRERLSRIARQNPGLKVRGRGLMQGLVVDSGEIADAICRYCFEQGLVIETSGSLGQVVKCLVPLTITREELDQGLDILGDAVRQVLRSRSVRAVS